MARFAGLALLTTDLVHVAGQLSSTANSFVKLPGARCPEWEGVYPVGGAGEQWRDEFLLEAQTLCEGDRHCTGVMRYIGDTPAHCEAWCGRPQFCEGPPGSGSKEKGLTLNADWVSFVRAEYLEAFGLRELPNASSALNRQAAWGPSGEATSPLRSGELFREAACNDFGVQLWQGPQVVLLPAAAVPATSSGPPAFPGTCRVAYRPFGTPEVASHAVDGILSEVLEKDLPLFSAALGRGAETGGRQERTEPEAPWRYYLDPVPEYPVDGLGIPGIKRHTLSVYFLNADSRCPAPNGTSLSADDVASLLSSDHVYVEDGSHARRAAAFRPYHFSLLCGDFTAEPFPPAALVYSIAYVSYALVPEFLHWKASRLFYHLPDAAQGYRTLTVANLPGYLENMLNSPAQEKVIDFKQTFALLCQQLIWYRYRETARRRADVAACALCEARHRAELRRTAAAAAIALPGAEAEKASEGSRTPAAAALGNAAVAVVFCGMSRRGAHELRRVVRETWGRAVAEAAPAAAQRFFVGRAADTPLADAAVGDVVELPVLESYRALNVKAFTMLSWAWHAFPNLQWLVRHDDDVYLRATALLAQLRGRPPVRYYWGMFDHGSSPVRDQTHQHYNSYEQFPKQQHPAWGDIFPPYARGLLWAMSVDLVGAVVAEFLQDVGIQPGTVLDEATANQMPHPDDPAVGVVVTGLVQKGISINIDDRDFNSFSLNPSCNSTFSNIHNRTWVVHHVKPETMNCMWALDTAEAAAGVAAGNSATDASHRVFPDLCLCSAPVEEEEDADPDGQPFWYDRERFNNAR